LQSLQDLSPQDREAVLQELQQKNDTQSAEQKENYEALKPV
jgi:hypothetical protein